MSTLHEFARIGGIIAALLLLAVGLFASFLRHVPEGWEDERGWHRGKEPDGREPDGGGA